VVVPQLHNQFAPVLHIVKRVALERGFPEVSTGGMLEFDSFRGRLMVLLVNMALDSGDMAPKKFD